MILFSSKKLECKISNNALTAWEKTKYLIFMVASYNISYPVYVFTPSFGPKPPPWHIAISLFSALASVLISYFGIKKCYKTNMGIDSACFMERFVMLNIPMTIKFCLFWFSTAIVYFSLVAYIMEGKALSNDPIYYLASVIGIIAFIIYYILLNRSFHRLALLMGKDKTP